MFESTPLSTPQKIGVVLLGLLACVGTAVVTSIVGCLLGIAIELITRQGGWLPLIGLFYGFYAGILIGLIVWWRFCVKRLR